MSRGGDDNDFIKAMFQVARMLKLIPYDQMMENRENRRLENRIQCEFLLLMRTHIVFNLI